MCSALKAVSSDNTKAVCMIKDNYARVLRYIHTYTQQLPLGYMYYLILYGTVVAHFSAQGKVSEALEHLQSLPLEDDITFQLELALALYRKLKFSESGEGKNHIYVYIYT